MKNNLIKYFIGEKITIEHYPKGEFSDKSTKGILINFNFKRHELTILREDGFLVIYPIDYKNKLFIDNYKDIRNKILSTLKPKKLNRFENIEI